MKNLLIVPTRSRPHKAIEFYEAFKEYTSSDTTLCFAIDDDDDSGYDQSLFPDVVWEVNERLRLGGTLNLVANKYCNDYDYLSFMGDDHRVRTSNWDQILTSDPIENLIAYGNDLIHGINLPTAVLMDSNIVKKLGHMSPPPLKHLYLDNYWLDLGQVLKSIRYYDDVIIEHMHYSVGKSDEDALYKELNSAHQFDQDQSAWINYRNNDFITDLEKLR